MAVQTLHQTSNLTVALTCANESPHSMSRGGFGWFGLVPRFRCGFESVRGNADVLHLAAAVYRCPDTIKFTVSSELRPLHELSAI
jgi:hypothetical protein